MEEKTNGARKAYVLVQVGVGQIHRVREKILDKENGIQGVKSCEAIVGEHDLIVRIEAGDDDEIEKISKRIYLIEDVHKTITCNVLQLTT